MKNNTAIDVFDRWALSNKDKGMEEGHNLSVERMIQISKNIKFQILIIYHHGTKEIKKLLN